MVNELEKCANIFVSLQLMRKSMIFGNHQAFKTHCVRVTETNNVRPKCDIKHRWFGTICVYSMTKIIGGNFLKFELFCYEILNFFLRNYMKITAFFLMQFTLQLKTNKLINGSFWFY